MSGRDGSITYLPAAVCDAMGIPPPAIARAGARLPVAGDPLEKILVFAPDAIGAALWEEPRAGLERVLRCAPHRLHVRSVLPPKTPVCFASMFSGAPPEAHGLTAPERRRLECDTLFDAWIRAGRNVAIVTVEGSSIDILFRDCAHDHYAEPYDPDVLERALEVLDAGRHDAIVVYQQEYDDTMHRTTPRSGESLAACVRHVGAFERLAAAAGRAWSSHPRAIAFTPDHGAHTSPETGRGDHGEDRPEDMEVCHCWGFAG